MRQLCFLILYDAVLSKLLWSTYKIKNAVQDRKIIFSDNYIIHVAIQIVENVSSCNKILNRFPEFAFEPLCALNYM